MGADQRADGTGLPDDPDALEQIIDARRIVHLPPFLDTAPYVAAVANRQLLRDELADERELDPDVPWIAVVAMMRPGDKLDGESSMLARYGVGRPSLREALRILEDKSRRPQRSIVREQCL